MAVSESDIDSFRAEIERILASSEFASSRQLQDFLRYTSERAFLGESQLDQNEIASAVLRRGSDFNPVEDASVRKMASQVRQRLEHYYSRPDHSSGIVVNLPVRCYVPKFERRARVDSRFSATVHTDESSPRTKSPIAIWYGAAVTALAIALGAVLLGGHPFSRVSDDTGAFELWTVRGDINTGANDAPGGGVRLGPKLREMDEITCRLEFTPNREAQQAGLIVWQDGLHFIRFGRKFFGRNQFEFLLEEGKTPFTIPGNTVYDPEGQSGKPVWLGIRRRGNSYQAFLSADGIRWRAQGEPIVPRQPFASPRAGIYALNGRRDAPSIRARFQGLATGWTFDGSMFPPVPAGDWVVTNTCPATTTAAIEGHALRIGFSANPNNCSYDISRPLGGGDWEISTRMDSLSLPGRSSGLRVQGSKGVVRVARYYLNGPSICFINDGKTLLGLPDLNGSPAVFLRLAAHNGVLRAGFSADGESFQQLPVNMKVDDLGTNLRGGVRFSIPATDQEDIASTASFYAYRERVETLVPYR